MIWQPAPAMLSLPCNEVHVWCASLRLSRAKFEKAKSVLAADERARAARFRLDRHQREFITARATLRVILTRYLGGNAADFEFRYGSFGKPALAVTVDDIRFNLSHSGSLVVCAVARAEVGVDIEKVRSDLNFGIISEHVFASCDSARLRELPQGSQAIEFFRLWTRTEALIKASGNGFSDFRTSSQPPNMLALRPKFACEYIDPAPGYVGAVVIQGAGSKFSYWHSAFW